MASPPARSSPPRRDDQLDRRGHALPTGRIWFRRHRDWSRFARQPCDGRHEHRPGCRDRTVHRLHAKRSSRRHVDRCNGLRLCQRASWHVVAPVRLREGPAAPWPGGLRHPLERVARRWRQCGGQLPPLTEMGIGQLPDAQGRPPNPPPRTDQGMRASRLVMSPPPRCSALHELTPRPSA